MLNLWRNPSDEVGKLFLRLAVGGLMLFHGIGKIAHGIGFIEHALQAIGLPGFIGYGVYVAEVIAPMLIILGYQTRAASLVVAFDMLVAVALFHRQDIFLIRESGALGIEIEAFFFIAALALFFMGTGKYRVTISDES
jgi:putative oxidoreductase